MNKILSTNHIVAGLICFLILLSADICFAGSAVDEKLGPFRVYHSLSESKLITKYGRGYEHVVKDSKNEVIMEKEHLYYIPEQEIWLQIGMTHVLDQYLERHIDSLLLTRKPLCDKIFTAKNSLGTLSTSQGIKIGDTIERVIEIYGEPREVIQVGRTNRFSALVYKLKLNRGTILRYDNNKNDELLFAEYYFEDNKLHSILISAEE